MNPALEQTLDGMVAIITGSAGGVGRASAVEFARRGARICVADLDENGGRETAERVVSDGGKAFFQPTDVSLSTSVESMVRATVERYGGLHILYNNAAATRLCNKDDRPVTELPEWVWDKMIAVCLKSVYLCCKFGIPEIKKAGGGCVINTSTVDAMIGSPGYDAYTAAKGGVIAITRSMAVEYARDRIRVNCIAPGNVESDHADMGFTSPDARKISESLHLTRLGRPSDIARFAAFLASPQSEYITGGIFNIDGGYTAFKAGEETIYAAYKPLDAMGKQGR